MVKFKKMFCFLVFLITFSCTQKEKKHYSEYVIEARNFNFTSAYVSKYNVKVERIKANNSDTFIYFADYIDTLEIKNNKVYFRNILLKRIDSRNIKLDDTIFRIDKYYFKNKGIHTYDMYIFINRENGLIFSEFLNSGHMTEYNTKMYNRIHRLIALKLLNFKNGKFELKYAKRVYPELKE